MPEILGRLQVALADRYRIDREIGAGGMATVYLAQDLRHDRKVALKLLRPELSAVIGAEAVAMSPEELRKYLASEDATWMPVVRKANIKAE